MKIIVDAMGGDNAPLEIVKGALQAQKRFGADIVFTGDEAAILDAVKACGLTDLPDGAAVIPTTETVEMCDDPATVFRRKKDTSMGVGLTLLKNGGGDAMVSAGSTGALLTGATLITKRIHGIRRAAMAPVIPTATGSAVLIDCGANADCTPEYLLQFAYMGSYYARTMLGIAAPRVGLLSNGTEDHKGSELQHETFPLLKAADAAGRIRFIGNVEASQVFSGDVDVVVTDGFTGNVLLKGIEGSIKYMTRQLKGIFMKNFKTKMAALAIRDEFHALKASLDPNEVGGTAMLGISKPVIKAHGSSDARAIYNAIRQAIAFVDSGIIDDITANISYMRVDKHAAKESN